METPETLDSQNNEDIQQDDGVEYDPNTDDDPDADPNQDDDPPEADPTQVEASLAPVRPTFQPRNIEEHMQLLSDKVDPDVLNSIFAVMNANYVNARGGETIADHYVNQIEQAAPGFITAQERTFIRNMPPNQQADPGSVAFAAFSRSIQKASQSGNTVEAIDEFCADWMKRRGKTVAARPAAPVIPPSQRAGGTSGGGGGTVTRPVSKQSNGGNLSHTSTFLSGLGFDKTEVRELERTQGVQSGR